MTIADTKDSVGGREAGMECQRVQTRYRDAAFIDIGQMHQFRAEDL